MFSSLNKDGHSCNRFSSFIAYVSGSRIEFAATFDEQVGYKNISVDSELNRREVHALKPLRRSLRGPVAVAADVKRKIIFVTDIQTEQILAIPLNGSKRLVLVEHVRRAEGLDYDAANGDLYFACDDSIQRINVKNLDEKSLPQKPTTVLELNRDDLVRGIAVDSCTKTIYFTNWRIDKPAIERVNYDGTQRHSFITTDIQTPNAIIIDHKAKKLYWLDARMGKIECIKKTRYLSF